MKGAIDTFVRKDTVEKNKDDESSKLIIEIKEQTGLMEKVVSSSILCPECHLFFAGDDIKHHDCKRKAIVMMKRIKLN